MAIFKVEQNYNLNALYNLYRFYLQREPDENGLANYSHSHVNHVQDYLRDSAEFRNLKNKLIDATLNKKLNYTVIKINDRGIDAINNLQSSLQDNLNYHNNIEFIDGRVTNIEEFYSSRGIKINWVTDLFNSGLSQEPSKAELGCAASHIVAMEYLIDSDFDELIVFEDDVITSKNFTNILACCMKDLPKDYDFMADSFIIPNADELYTVLEQIGIGSNYICKAHLQNSHTGFMLYSKKGAIKILEMYKKYGVLCAIDTFLFWLGRRGTLNAYTTYNTNTLLQGHSLYGTLITDR